MVDSNPIIKTINTYIVVPPKLTLVKPPPKVPKNSEKLEAGQDSQQYSNPNLTPQPQLGFFQRHFTQCTKLSLGPISTEYLCTTKRARTAVQTQEHQRTCSLITQPSRHTIVSLIALTL